VKNGGLLKENKVFWVMFLMEEYGKNLMVKNNFFSQKREMMV
jgi:hypothetical protein